MSLLIFVLILTILILVHEWGHFITAKKCGVKVEQFALGFGPKLFSRFHNGTEFCLCAIPLGGYVKMAGDERGHLTGAKNEFLSQSTGNRALIVLMGPVVNLILAYICFWFVFMIGYVDMDASAKKVPPVIGQVLSGSPAAQAGVMTGDQIISIDGKNIAHWPDLQDYVMGSTQPKLNVVLERHGHMMSVAVAPQDETLRDIFGRQHHARKIGVGPMPLKDSKDVVVVRYGFFGSFVRAGQELVDITAKTYQALFEMIIGMRSPKEAMGIVGMFFVIKFALSIGFSFLLHIVGIISASLAIFNLLPVIPLDGGHLFLYGLEKLRGKALSVRMDMAIARVGFSLIVTLALFVFYVDFERIGLIDKLVHIFKPMG